MSETTKNPLGAAIDGAAKMYGMKEGAITGLAERVGAFASVAVPTVILNDKFRIKPALAKLPAQQANAVVSNVMGGSVTIGKF